VGANTKHNAFAARSLARGMRGKILARDGKMRFKLGEVTLVFASWHDAAVVLSHLRTAAAVKTHYPQGTHVVPGQPLFGPAKL
jgi:hypothetical protein